METNKNYDGPIEVTDPEKLKEYRGMLDAFVKQTGIEGRIDTSKVSIGELHIGLKELRNEGE
jgi:hypothetical protein